LPASTPLFPYTTLFRSGMKDAVVVGGGIAGLTAAWRLRDLDTILLESEPCVGGRIRSFERDGHWVSVGAHMFPGRGSFLWELLRDRKSTRLNSSHVAIS